MPFCAIPALGCALRRLQRRLSLLAHLARDATPQLLRGLGVERLRVVRLSRHPAVQRQVHVRLVDHAVVVQERGHLGEAALGHDEHVGGDEVGPHLHGIAVQVDGGAPLAVAVEVSAVPSSLQGTEHVNIRAGRVHLRELCDEAEIPVVTDVSTRRVFIHVTAADVDRDRRDARLECQWPPPLEQLAQRVQKFWGVPRRRVPTLI
mmetsp:Transcript_59177/g.164928  ORF Transcript_59177/g.164928 Transcript_59177/m.164928 type:complete len:205 (-) Transcript_59177:643-1257(-)